MRESTSRICILLFWLLVNCIPSITQSFFHSTANLQLNTQIHASALSPELPMMLRLERILANRGLGSRAEVLALIKAGRVRTVDGQIIRSAAGKFPSNISIMVNEKLSQQVNNISPHIAPNCFIITISLS